MTVGALLVVGAAVGAPAGLRLLGLGGAATTGSTSGSSTGATIGADPGVAAAPPVEGAGAATGLDPELAARFAAAQEAAAADDVTLTLTSGWRSAEAQERLVADALARYGDPTEAHRWVLPPETSSHVQGLAVDVGPTQGAYWLQEHGLEHGLCPTYANEVWHFEMLPVGAQECPEPHEDSSWGW